MLPGCEQERFHGEWWLTDREDRSERVEVLQSTQGLCRDAVSAAGSGWPRDTAGLPLCSAHSLLELQIPLDKALICWQRELSAGKLQQLPENSEKKIY